MPISSGRQPAVANETNRASGLSADLVGLVRRHHDSRGGSVRHLRRIAGRHRSFDMKRRLAALQGFRAMCRDRGPSSVSKTTSLRRTRPFSSISSTRTVNGTISSLNLPALIAATAFWCEPKRKFVRLFARDLVFAGEVLGRQAHVQVIVRIRYRRSSDLAADLLPPIGIIDIVSRPPATITSAPPVAIRSAASAMVCSPDEQ